MTTYNPLPVSFVRGEGVWLFDAEGTAYLDALGGIAVCALGHAHPAVTQAITEQASALLHTSNLFTIDNQIALANKLCSIAKMERAFFCNSGAEANEAAIKLSRLHARNREIDNPQIIVMEHSFHGRTMATLSATASKKVQAGYAPLVPGFIRVPYNDAAAVDTIMANNVNVVAILVEPISGEGGVVVPDDDYLDALRELCDRFNCLLMIDEVQTGMGRTGKFFAYEHQPHLLPDVVTVAKALGNGVPIGACLARGEAAKLFQPGSHGSTFGGNPFCTHVSLAVIETLEKENLVSRAGEAGRLLMELLHSRLDNNPHVKEIRGRGLMIGIELDKPCRDILNIGLKNGLLFGVTADSVIRLLPPYIMTDEQLHLIADKLTATIEQYYA
ncbi:MAG: aspartate aminotransferase family protein [Legionellales bacterium]|nr:aspartate aminotransferase family protein [Legionellales bacterium]